VTSTLLRSCLGCGRSVRGKPRCRDCHANRDHAKRKRRPDLDQRDERRRRERTVADHRLNVGDWCPGWERQPAHPSADLTADHVIEVAAGAAASGPLVVRCRSCNAARSANVRSQLLGEPVPPMGSALPTPRQPKLPTQTEAAAHHPAVA
jgi:5-methylcytosine-specific restriction enzyme A